MARFTRLRAALPFLLATAGAGALLSLISNRTQLFLFQARDLARARAIFTGEIPFFGPELSGNGNLPGSFYYFLLALPSLFTHDWRGAWLLAVVLASVAFGIMVSFFWRRFGAFPALLAAIFLAPVADYAQNFALFLNPSFLPLFVVAALLAFTRAVAGGDDQARARWWLFGCLLLGFAVQIHTSILVLFPAAAFHWLRSPRPEGGRWPTLAKGLLVFALPILPYLAWQLSGTLGHAFGAAKPSYPGPAGGPEGGFLLRRLWIQFHQPGPVPAGAMTQNGLAICFAIFSPCLLGALPVAFRMRARAEEPDGFAPRARRFWGTAALLAALPAGVQLSTGHYARYDFLFVLVFPFFAAATARSWLRDRPARDWALVFTAGLGSWIVALAIRETFSFNPLPLPFGWLALAALLPLAARLRGKEAAVLPLTLTGVAACAALMSGYFGTNQGRGLPDVSDFQALVREVGNQTGWSFGEARDRIFFVNVRNELSPEMLFTTPGGRPATPGGSHPDGFFFAWMEARDRGRRDYTEWLLEQPLHADVARALRESRLRLGPVLPTRTGFVAPYFSSADGFTEGFQNLGRPYDLAASRPPRPAPNTAIFNDCPTGDERCAFSLSVENAPGGKLRFRIQGPVLSLPSIWISYNWIEQVRDVFLDVRCREGASPKRIAVASSVGLFTLPDEQLNNRSVLAPFVRSVPNPCAKAPAAVRLGYGSARVIRKLEGATFPGKSAELAFDPAYAFPAE